MEIGQREKELYRKISDLFSLSTCNKWDDFFVFTLTNLENVNNGQNDGQAMFFVPVGFANMLIKARELLMDLFFMGETGRMLASRLMEIGVANYVCEKLHAVRISKKKKALFVIPDFSFDIVEHEDGEFRFCTLIDLLEENGDIVYTTGLSEIPLEKFIEAPRISYEDLFNDMPRKVLQFSQNG